ncbi:NAD-dependent epimerase/dehydratase family protein [Ruminococcus flavefaciens]|uniref:NAD-dependent epimerase/dehydratase family protein n=1 Tax=Ruminococcus flavefaciens TaxID=1265 RepID=UPI0009B919FA|nr:NAD-dependent epimerase/dehydratase family protein [Ruminococcus flavefaciens]
MNILVLGGTGAMGTHLISFLSENNDVQVTVTSRKERNSHGNISYIVGNAREKAFMSELLKKSHYDVIVDFMNYNYEEFLEYHRALLSATDHYIFLSSSRVYANYEGRITESCPRLLETSKDQAFLSTNRYALRKAREEDMLRASGMNNYTIIRPYITYSNRRLQLGIYEKEEWLYRVLNDKPLIMSEGILDKTTTLSYGRDVSFGIYKIALGKPLADAVHITTTENMTWLEILKMYASIIKKQTGKDIVLYTSPEMKSIEMIYEGGYNTIYDRQWNRQFDNAKAELVCEHIDYLGMQEGLSGCLEEFLRDWKVEGNAVFLPLNSEYEKEMDRLTQDPSVQKEIVQL